MGSRRGRVIAWLSGVAAVLLILLIGAAIVFKDPDRFVPDRSEVSVARPVSIPDELRRQHADYQRKHAEVQSVADELRSQIEAQSEAIARLRMRQYEARHRSNDNLLLSIEKQIDEMKSERRKLEQQWERIEQRLKIIREQRRIVEGQEVFQRMLRSKQEKLEELEQPPPAQ